MKKLYILLVALFCLGIGTGKAQEKILHTFSLPNGADPPGGLILAGGKLYGVASGGGSYSLGCVFSMDTTGNNYKDLRDFNYTGGNVPEESLVYSSGVLYGIAQQGGRYSDGVVFSIDTNGANYQDLHDFNDTNGKEPSSTLTLSGTKLYGTTYYGGPYNHGTIFSINTNGSGFKTLFYFNGVNGYDAGGPLVLSGNSLIGTTTYAGSYNYGVIYSIDTDGNGFKFLFSFNRINGYGPETSVTFSANGNIIYGVTSEGGVNTDGNVFSMNKDGSGFKDLFDFNGTDGETPSEVILSGSQLYGVSLLGGANNYGNIFVIDTDGTGFHDLLDFNGTNGKQPGGPLLFLNKSFYGLSIWGGLNNYGVAFSFKDTNLYASVSGTYYYCAADEGTAKVSIWGGTSPYTYRWSPGGQTTDSISGLSVGTYSVTVTDSKHSKQTSFVSISNQPVSILPTASPDTILIGFPSNLSVSCSIPATYVWAPSGATTQNITVTPNATTTYTLVATTACGTYTTTITVYVTTCPNNFTQPICIATLDTANNKNKIIWGRTNSPPASGYGYYNIYKDTGRGYVLLHSQPLDSLSEYVDTSNTWGPVRYQISTVDSCGESTLSAPHTTIFLTTTASLNAYNLSWTAYGGFTPTKYRIFRGPSLNALKQIDSVANNVLTYTDSFPPINSVYAIEAVSPNGVCIPTTHRPNSRLSASLSGSFSNGFNTATLGIQNVNTSLSKLNIYPNPNNGVFTLNYSLNCGGNVRTTIINELGQVVYDNTGKKNSGSITEQLNLGNLATGIYSLRLQTDNSIMVRKLVLMGNR